MITRIGKYKIEAELGRGGYGQVYKAWDPDVRQAVAIKTIVADGDPDLLKRFHLEVVTTASLHHKNIVAIYASGEEDGTPYLVMELLEGQTLAQIIKRGVSLTPMEKVRIMTQVAEGLAFAHSKGVVHRDVKPANIMLLPDDSVRIMDFGIALASSRRTLNVTMDGCMVGTVPYMSPEQFSADGKANEQTDIFSFGTVFYELVTGKHPFHAQMGDLNSLRVAILTRDPQPLSQLAPECPDALEPLVHRCLAKEPAFRYQTFEELRLDSTSVLTDLQHDRASAILSEVPRLVAKGEFQDARAAVRQAQKLEPGNRQARQLLETIDQNLQEIANREKIAARLADAEVHIAGRRFAEAVQTLEIAARLDNSNLLVQMRLIDARARLDGSIQANRLVEEARAKQQRGELAEALECLNRALELDAEHTEAKRLLPKINELLTRRRLEQIRQQALQAASEHLAGKRYTEALAVLDRLESEQPGAPGIADLCTRIQQEEAEEERRVRAEKFNLAMARTSETMQAGDLERAGKMLTLLESNFAAVPEAEALRVLRERLNALLRRREIETCRQRAGDLLDRKSFREASELLAEALRKYPDDSGLLARQKIASDALSQEVKRSESIAAVIKRAHDLRDAGDFQSALNAISEGRSRLGDEAVFVDLALKLEPQVEQQRLAAGLRDLLAGVRTLISSGKFAEAIDRLAQANEYSGDAEVAALLDSARAAAEEQKVAARALAAKDERKIENRFTLAGQHLENHEYRLAREALQGVLAIRPDNRAFQMLAEVERRESDYEALGREKERIFQEAQRARGNGEFSTAMSRAERLLGLIQPAAGSVIPERDIAYQEFYNRVRSENEAVNQAHAEGQQCLAEKNFEKALEICGRYPQNPLFQVLKLEAEERQRHQRSADLAEVSLRVEAEPDFDKKVAIFEEAAGRYPGDRQFQEWLSLAREKRDLIASIVSQARACEQDGEFNEALGRWEALRRIYPQYPGLAFEIERLARQQAQEARGAALARLLEQIDRCLRTDDFERSLSLCHTALEEFPDEPLLHERENETRQRIELAHLVEQRMKEAEALISQGQVEDALGVLRSAMTLQVRKPLVRVLLVDTLARRALVLAEQDWRAAEPLVDEAINLDPAHGPTLALIQTLADHRKSEAAAQCLARARQLDAAGNTREAVAVLREGLKASPADSRLSWLLEDLRKKLLETERPAVLEELRSLLQSALIERTASGLRVILEKARLLAADYPADAEFLEILGQIEQRHGHLNRSFLTRWLDRTAASWQSRPALSLTGRGARRAVFIASAALIVVSMALGYRLLQKKRRSPTPPPMIQVQIDTAPGAQVLIDNKIRSGSGQTVPLPPGKHTVTASQRGYRLLPPREFTLPGEPLPLHLGLEPLPLQLRVITDQASGNVFLDDNLAAALSSQEAVTSINLASRHTIRIDGPSKYSVDLDFDPTHWPAGINSPSKQPGAALLIGTFEGKLRAQSSVAPVTLTIGAENYVIPESGLDLDLTEHEYLVSANFMAGKKLALHPSADPEFILAVFWNDKRQPPPPNPATLLSRARLLLERGSDDEAAALVDQVLRLDPGNDEGNELKRKLKRRQSATGSKKR